MARKRTNLSIDEQICSIEEQISIKEQELQHLKSQKKELLKKKKQVEMEELYNIIVESGKTLEEVKAMIIK